MIHTFNVDFMDIRVGSTVIEIMVMSGDALQIDAINIEVTLIETLRHDWLIRGLPGDELALNYKVGDETTN